MATYRKMDEVFTEEFNKMARERRGHGKLYIEKVPLPEFSGLFKNFYSSEIYIVKGIKEPFFEKLNGFPVQILKTPNIEARTVLSDGSFKREPNGNYEYKKVEIESGFVPITTPRVIKYQRSTIVNGVEKETKVRKGYRYVDYYDFNGERRYIYLVPKNCLNEVDLNVLVITVSEPKKYSRCIKVVLQSGHTIYIGVMPYSEFKGKQKFRLIGAKHSANFDKEIKELFLHWEKEGILFDRRLTELENPVTLFEDGPTNLAYKELPPNP